MEEQGAEEVSQTEQALGDTTLSTVGDFSEENLNQILERKEGSLTATPTPATQGQPEQTPPPGSTENEQSHNQEPQGQDENVDPENQKETEDPNQGQSSEAKLSDEARAIENVQKKFSDAAHAPELTKGYANLQKVFAKQGTELGELRKENDKLVQASNIGVMANHIATRHPELGRLMNAAIAYENGLMDGSITGISFEEYRQQKGISGSQQTTQQGQPAQTPQQQKPLTQEDLMQAVVQALEGREKKSAEEQRNQQTQEQLDSDRRDFMSKYQEDLAYENGTIKNPALWDATKKIYKSMGEVNWEEAYRMAHARMNVPFEVRRQPNPAKQAATASTKRTSFGSNGIQAAPEPQTVQVGPFGFDESELEKRVDTLYPDQPPA